MKAAVLRADRKFPEIENDFEIETDRDLVQVKMKYGALNHRDLWICKGKYSNIRYPIILGSDGCGMLGGKEVIINPGMNWGENEAFQAGNFKILGLPDHGTLAEYCYVPAAHIYSKPSHLSAAEAAALPLGGVTAYRALFTKAKISAEDKVLINGAGGGVSHIAFSMAKAIGCEVFITTGSDNKLTQLMEAGASGGVNYKDKDYVDKLKDMAGRFDVILDSAGGQSFSSIFSLCTYGARVAIFGGTTGNIPSISPQILFWRQVEILGTTMGSPKDFSDMLDFVNKHKIVPAVDAVYPLNEIEFALERMASGQQLGKIVLEI